MAKYHYRNPGFGVDDVMPQPMVLPGSDSAETIYDYGARYDWSGGLGGPGYTRGRTQPQAGDPFNPYFDQERVRLSERARLRQALDPEDGFAGFLHHGYDQVKGSIVDAARAGDRQRVDEGLQILRDFRDQYRKDLARWALDGATGGPRAAAMAGNAEEILTEGFLQMPIATGYDGKGAPVQSVPLQMYLDSGFNVAPDAPTSFLRSKFPATLAEINNAARIGDVAEVRRLAGVIDTFYKDNQTAVARLLSYSNMLGDVIGPEVVTSAHLMATGKWKAQAIPFKVGVDGKAEQSFTVDELLYDMPDKLKDRAATTVAERYKVDRGHAAAAVDPKDPYHGLFAPLLSKVETGVASQAASGTGDPEAARRTERAATEMRAVSRHFNKSKDFWDVMDDGPDHATAFYHAAAEGFGPSLTDKQLDAVFQGYRSRVDRGDDVNARDYVLDFAEAVKAAVPMGRRLEADPSNPESTRVVETQKPLVRQDRVQHDFFDVLGKLDTVGANPDPGKCSARLKENREKAYGLESFMGVSLDELGLGRAVVDQTSFDLANGRSELLGAKHEGRALSDMETAFNILATKTGGSTRADVADIGANLPVTVRHVNAAVLKAYGAARSGGDLSFEEFLSTNALEDSQLVDDVAGELASSFGVTRGDGVRAIAQEYLQGLYENDGITLTQVLKRNAGLLEEKKTPTGEKQLVPSTPHEYASPATGAQTREAPDATGGLGMYSTDPKKYNKITGAARGRAERELDDMANGRSAVTRGDGEAQRAARGLAAGVLKTQNSQHATGDRDEARTDTSALATDAGRVMFDNMETYIRKRDGDAFRPDSEVAGIWNFVKSGDLIRFLEGHDKSPLSPDIGSGMDSLNGSAAHFVAKAVEQLETWRSQNAVASHANEARMLAALVSEVLPVLSNRRVSVGTFMDHGGASEELAASPVYILARMGLVAPDFWSEYPSNSPLYYKTGRFALVDLAGERSIDDHQINAARDNVLSRLSNHFHFDADNFTWLTEVGYERAPHEGVRWTHADYGGILRMYDHNHRTDPKLYLGAGAEVAPGVGGTRTVPDIVKNREAPFAYTVEDEREEWGTLASTQHASDVSLWALRSLVPVDERVAQLEKTFLARAYSQFPGDPSRAEAYIKNYTTFIEALADEARKEDPENWYQRVDKLAREQMSRDVVTVPVKTRDPSTGQAVVRYESRTMPRGEAISRIGGGNLLEYYQTELNRQTVMKRQEEALRQGEIKESQEEAKNRVNSNAD